MNHQPVGPDREIHVTMKEKWCHLPKMVSSASW